jgi:hypothetical protein
LLVDFLASLAWPASAVVVAVLFRDQVRSLLPRMRKAGPAGLEFDPDGPQGEGQENLLTSPTENRTGTDLPADPGIEEVEGYVRENIKDVPDQDKIRVLVRMVAVERLEKHFVRIYFNIFGSQIEALKLLNQSGGRTSLRGAAEKFAALQKLYAEFEDWTLERYISFLRVNQLIEEDSGSIYLTDIGRLFLHFLTKYGLSEERPL